MLNTGPGHHLRGIAKPPRLQRVLERNDSKCMPRCCNCHNITFTDTMSARRPQQQDHYAVLQLRKGATQEEIKQVGSWSCGHVVYIKPSGTPLQPYLPCPHLCSGRAL
jgi:hypothetical protein